jgi:hypothetical protein
VNRDKGNRSGGSRKKVVWMKFAAQRECHHRKIIIDGDRLARREAVLSRSLSILDTVGG